MAKLGKAVSSYSQTDKAATDYTVPPTVTSTGVVTPPQLRAIPLAEALAASRVATTQLPQHSIKSKDIGENTVLGSNIATETITGENVSSLNVSGKTATLDTGTIAGWTISTTELVAPAGSAIRSGQTTFNTGIGYYLGNLEDTPKFSVGNSSGDNVNFDGSSVRITGNLVLSSAFQNKTYATADLPVPPTSVGFSSPAGNE